MAILMERGIMAFLIERGDFVILMEIGDLVILRERVDMVILRERGDMAILGERGDMSNLRVRKCDVTLLMTVGTVCIAACTAVPRMMAIYKLQAALYCLPAYCILSCTIWLTVLKFITSQL